MTPVLGPRSLDSCGKKLLRISEDFSQSLLSKSMRRVSKLLLSLHRGKLGGGGGNSTYYVTGTCHFARKIGTHNSVNSGGF